MSRELALKFSEYYLGINRFGSKDTSLALSCVGHPTRSSYPSLFILEELLQISAESTFIPLVHIQRILGLW